MAEDPRKYPPVRSTIIDGAWSSPTGVASERELPVPQAPSAVASGIGGESVDVKSLSNSLPPESAHPRPLVVAAKLPTDPGEGSAQAAAGERMGQAAGVGGASNSPALALSVALRQNVRFFGATLALGTLVFGAFLAAVVGAFFVGRRFVTTPVEPTANTAQPSPSVSSGSPVAPPPAPASSELATPTALNALLSKPKSELSIDEAASVVEAERAREVQAAEALAREFIRNPELVNVEQPLKRFKQFAMAEPTAKVTLLAMARLPGQIAADLLYEVWTGSAEKTSATKLAQMLLYGQEVLPKASPALRVALDLRAAESCEENHAILPRAIAVGDRRSLHLLALLQRKFGCGPKRKDDCYACLRVGNELADALKAVRARRSPEL